MIIFQYKKKETFGGTRRGGAVHGRRSKVQYGCASQQAHGRHQATSRGPHAGKRGTPHGPVLDGNEVVAKAEEDETQEDRHHHRDAVVGTEHQRIAPRIAQGPAADLNKLQTIKGGNRGVTGKGRGGCW